MQAPEGLLEETPGQLQQAVTVARNPDGSTSIAFLPSVCESDSQLATEIRERRSATVNYEQLASEAAWQQLFRHHVLLDVV